MPSRLAPRVLLLLLVLLVMPLAFARAGGGATSQFLVNTVAPSQNMSCSWDGAWYCSDVQGLPRYARFVPQAGPVTDLTVQADSAAPLDSGSQAVMNEFLVAVCPDPGNVKNFTSKVGALNVTGSTVPTETWGGCVLNGGLNPGSFRSGGLYWVSALVLAPTPTPPPPTPPPPTPAPTSTPQPVVTPPPTPTPTPTPSPTPSPTLTPTPSPTPRASPTRTPRPSATPEQTVAGITFAPEPSLPPPNIAGDPTGWAASVHDPADISTDPAAMGVSALLAVLLLLFMGFVGELFNNTVKAHYDELSGWWHKGLIGRLAAAWSAIWKSGP